MMFFIVLLLVVQLLVLLQLTSAALQYPIKNAFEPLEPIRIDVLERSEYSGEWRTLTTLHVRYGDWSANGTVAVTVNATVPRSGQQLNLRFEASSARDDVTYRADAVAVIDLLVERVPDWSPKRFLLSEPPRTPPAGDEAKARAWHWKSKISVSLLDDFDVHASPDELPLNARYYYEHYSRAVDGARDRFAPILFVHDMYNFGADDFVLLPANRSTLGSLPVTITYAPQTLLRYQWMIDLSSAFMQGDNPLLAKEDGEDMRRMFLDTHPYLLYATSLVSLLHIVFDVLAFKNDIAFWRHRKSFEGLSLRYLFASALSQAVVFLYLANERSSKLVIVPAGIAALVELWKITRAFTVSLLPQPDEPAAARRSLWQRLQLRERHARRDETAAIDAQAWRTLGPVLALIWLVYAAYTLVFVKQAGWYGWALGSAVGLVYGAGFIMMTPQLYLNHKLKSVAHLPWRVFVYKAMNTFIDDLFAFVIKMPTMHRVACFRDDLVFCVFLYQRYIYPTDHTRTNEYGQTSAPADPAATTAAAPDDTSKPKTD